MHSQKSIKYIDPVMILEHLMTEKKFNYQVLGIWLDQ